MADLSSSSFLFQAVVYTLKISVGVWSAGFIITLCLNKLYSWWKQKANLCWKKPNYFFFRKIASVMDYTDAYRMGLLISLSDFFFILPRISRILSLTTMKIAPFHVDNHSFSKVYLQNLITSGKAPFARHVGHVSLLHSLLSVLFYLTSMSSPSCVVHVRYRLCSLCYCLHSFWAISSWMNFLLWFINISSVFLPTHVLIVLTLALLIHEQEISFCLWMLWI